MVSRTQLKKRRIWDELALLCNTFKYNRGEINYLAPFWVVIGSLKSVWGYNGAFFWVMPVKIRG